MRVLIVLETLSAGGAEIFAMNWATQANKEGVETDIYCFHRRLSKQSTIETNLIGTKTKYAFKGVLLDKLVSKFDSALRKIGLSKSIRNYKIKRDLKHLMKGYDVVHSHLLPADWMVSTVDRPQRCLHFTTIHGDYLRHHSTPENERKIDGLEGKFRDIWDSLNGMVCITDHQIVFFNQELKVDVPLRKIYNGFSKKTANHLKSDDVFKIGMVSRGIKEKGWKQACEAFVLAEIPNSELLLIGESDYLLELKDAYRTTPEIKFLGYQAEPQKLIGAFDLGLLPSYYGSESLPTVVIEYLNAGVPVIATKIGEVRNMLTTDSGLAGAIIELENGVCPPEKLSEQMRMFWSNQSMFIQLKENARLASQKFGVEQCVTNYLEFYKDCSTFTTRNETA